MADLVDVQVMVLAPHGPSREGRLVLASAGIKLPVPSSPDLLTDQQLEDWVRVAALKLLPAISVSDPRGLREFFKAARSG